MADAKAGAGLGGQPAAGSKRDLTLITVEAYLSTRAQASFIEDYLEFGKAVKSASAMLLTKCIPALLPATPDFLSTCEWGSVERNIASLIFENIKKWPWQAYDWNVRMHNAAVLNSQKEQIKLCFDEAEASIQSTEELMSSLVLYMYAKNYDPGKFLNLAKSFVSHTEGLQGIQLGGSLRTRAARDFIHVCGRS